MHIFKSIKEYWKKICFILTPDQKKWGIVLAILTLGGAGLETLGVSAILPLVQVMIEPQMLREAGIIASITEVLGLDTDKKLIWAVGFFAIGVYIFKNLYMVLLSYIRVKYSCKVQRELSVEMMDSYMKKGYLFFTETTSGQLLRGMTASVDSMYQGLYQTLKIVSELLTIFCICIFILCTDFAMAFAVILLCMLSLLIVIFGFRNWTRKCGDINYKYIAIINQMLMQAFQGIKEVLVMHKQEFFLESYKEKYIKRQKGIIGQAISSESPAYLIEAICIVGFLFAVCFKATNSNDVAIMLSNLAAFAMAAFRILPSLGRISNHFNLLSFSMPGINDTYENLQGVRKEKKGNYFEIKVVKRELQPEMKKEIIIKDVYWKYPQNKKNVLEGISMRIEPGQSVAFVGPSGSGKTTLADIILGLLNPNQGYVLVDGVDIHEIPGQWSKMIGYVPQNSFLLDDTIRRNVAFGVRDEEIDDGMVWNALRQAQLETFVKDLAGSLDTLIGERGVRFSGGQRQRIAIARALYYNPDILVLDEATSALDNDTESAVMEAIECLQGQKTMIIIAHRLTTIKNCDKIYKIEEGQAKPCKYQDLV